MDIQKKITKGAVVQYRPEWAEEDVPHFVLEVTGDIACVKPLHMVCRERHGSVVVPVGRCKPLRFIERVTRPVFEPNTRHVHYLRKALRLLAETAKNGDKAPEIDELCAVHNLLNLLEDYAAKRKENR